MTRERMLGRASLKNGYQISTVFLGLDHGFGMTPKPILFETWVHDNIWGDNYYERYETWEQVEKGFGNTVGEYKKKKPWRIAVIIFMKGFPKWTNSLLQSLKKWHQTA